MNYNTRIIEIWSKIGENSLFVLATEENGNPSARLMSGIIQDGKIYFQTDSLSDKAREINKNNNVAVCINEIQIKGVCTECGHPMNEKNNWFINIFSRLYPEPYKKYTHLQTERLYCITPTMIKVWGKMENVTCIEKLDCDSRLYTVQKLEGYI